MSAFQNVQDFQKYQSKLNIIINLIENDENNKNYTREQINEIFKTLIPLYSNLFSYFKNIYENKKNNVDYDYDYITNSINFNENILKFNEKIKQKKLNEYNIISDLMNDINTIKRIVLRIPEPSGLSISKTIKHFSNYINYYINEINKENEEIKRKLINIINDLYETIFKKFPLVFNY